MSRRRSGSLRLSGDLEIRDATWTSWILSAVEEAEPGMLRETVRLVLTEVARTPQARGRVAREVTARRNVLTSGQADSLPETQRLIAQLVTAGATVLRRPRCTLCRRTRDLPMALPGGGRVCGTCQALLLREQCPTCQRWQRLRNRLVDGTAVCTDCARLTRQTLRASGQPTGPQGTGERRWGRLDGRPDDNDATRIGWVVAAVQAADPELAADSIRAVLLRIAPGREARTRIAREVAARPDVLTSGRPDSRPATQRLIKDLVAVGSTGLRRPSCSLCGRVLNLPMPLPDGGRACRSCQRRQTAQPCPGCGTRRDLHGRLVDGTRVCGSCARSDPARWQPCARCGLTRQVAWLTADGPHCRACHPDANLPCVECGRTQVTRRRCGKVMLCSRCTSTPRRICARCGVRRPHQQLDPGCPSCSSDECITCPTCGDTQFSATGCYRCRLRRRLALLIDSADPQRVEQLAPFLRALERTEDPRRGLDWLYRGRIAQQLITGFLHGRVLIDHATLDEANASRTKRSTSVEHLRYLLVASGVLPPRDELLHRLEEAIDHILAEAPSSETGVLRQWATWEVLPRVRRRATTTGISAGAAAGAKAKITAASRFLTWLHHDGTTLSRLSQAEVDQWAAAHAHQRAALAAFLTWAGHRGHTPRGIYAPTPPVTGSPQRFVDANELYACARRFLTDETIPAGLRLAGCLILLYGQPLNRICRLKTSDLNVDSVDISLRLGRTPLTLPPPLSEIARTAVRTAVRQVNRLGVSTGFTTDPIWLFPGLPMTKPLDPTALRRQLDAVLPGNIRGHRNTALITLAREMPSVVLADLLGLHRNTADLWRHRSGGNLANYTAARLANASRSADRAGR